MRPVLVERAGQGRRRVPHGVVGGGHRGRRRPPPTTPPPRPSCSRRPAPRSRPSGSPPRSASCAQATDRATASVDVTWDLGQGRRWHYLEQLNLLPRDGAPHGWLVQWSPSVVHPQLGAGQRLALRTEDAQPAPVVDRGGAPLLAATPVVTVLLDRRAAGNLATVAAPLAAALGPIDPEITQASITDGATKTPDGQSYTVAVLRAEPTTCASRTRSTSCPACGSPTTAPPRPGRGFASQVLPAVRREAAPQLDGVPGLVGARRRRHGQPDHARSSRRRRSPARRSRPASTGPSRPRPRTPSSRCRSHRAGRRRPVDRRHPRRRPERARRRRRARSR